jgi:hypothetical protein
VEGVTRVEGGHHRDCAGGQSACDRELEDGDRWIPASNDCYRILHGVFLEAAEEVAVIHRRERIKLSGITYQ